MAKRLTGFVIAFLVAAAGAGRTIAAQEPPAVNVRVARDGAPAANVAIEFRFVNGGKFSAGTTAASGDLAIAMHAVNGGKPIRLQVVTYDCRGNQSVAFVETGAAAPDNENCRKVIVGWVWFGRARVVALDLTRATLQTQGGRSFLSTTTGRLVAGGGAAVVGLALLSAGGDDNGQTGESSQGTTFNPNGNYPVSIVVLSDPGEHRTKVAVENSSVLTVAVTGSNITITCPPGSKLTLMSGTINTSTGQVTAEGRGPAAGFSNVLFRVAGTLVMSGANRGALSLVLTIGPNGELAGGPPITFNVTGAKQ